MTIGLRVSDEVERDGLDLALHGEIVQVTSARSGGRSAAGSLYPPTLDVLAGVLFFSGVADVRNGRGEKKSRLR